MNMRLKYMTYLQSSFSLSHLLFPQQYTGILKLKAQIQFITRCFYRVLLQTSVLIICDLQKVRHGLLEANLHVKVYHFKVPF